MQRSIRTTALTLAALAVAGTTLGGCASLNNKERGALIGAAAGAAGGAAVGSKNGGTARGAIIGAAVGGSAGAIIGHQMDQRAKELKQAIPNARVERVGEGILVTFDSGLLFDFNSDVLRPAARTNLQALAQNVDKYPNTYVMVVGHTDARGDDAYNQRLSERRANSALSYLRAEGIAPSRVRMAGRGEAEPVADNESESGRQANRRVEVALFADETAKATARQQASR